MEEVTFLISAGLLVLANVVWFAYRHERIRNTLEEWWGTLGTARKDEHTVGGASESGESGYRVSSLVACEHLWLLPSRPYMADMLWHEVREDGILSVPKMSKREKFALVLLLLTDSVLAAILLVCFVGLGPGVNCGIASVLGIATNLIGILVVILDIFFG